MERDSVRDAVRQLQANGDPVSARGVRRVLGKGSPRDILAHLRGLGLIPEAEAPAQGREVQAQATHQGARGDFDNVAQLSPSPRVQHNGRSVPPTAPEPPPTLLAQAQARLALAKAEEHRVRRELLTRGTLLTGDDLAPCTAETRRAQAEVDRLAMTVANLLAALPGARIEARRALGALTTAEDEARRRVLKARREASEAQQELARVVAALTSLAGPEAVPVDDAE
jgi:hypothetical protein